MGLDEADVEKPTPRPSRPRIAERHQHTCCLLQWVGLGGSLMGAPLGLDRVVTATAVYHVAHGTRPAACAKMWVGRLCVEALARIYDTR